MTVTIQTPPTRSPRLMPPRYRIRRVRPGESDALVAFYAALSPESRAMRFLGASSGLAPALAPILCNADHEHREGFVAVVGEGWRAGRADGAERIVGHLYLEPAGPDTEELAVGVADDWQRQGIGRALFEHAIAWSRQRGISRIVATAYSWNAPVLQLLSSVPEGSLVKAAGGGTVSVEIFLGPTSRRFTASRHGGPRAA